MPRRKRQPRIPTPAWEPSGGTLTGRLTRRNLRLYATGGVIALIVLALAVVGFAFLSDYWEDQRRPGSTAVQVDDTKFTVRYFADRLRMFVQQSGGPTSQNADPQIAVPSVAGQLVEEVALMRFASEMGASASEAEIRVAMAARLGTTADDPDFDTLFQEEISRSGLSEEQYNQMIEAAVLRDKVLDTLQSEVPTLGESVHYRLIVVNDMAAADDIVRQVEDGADFGELAIELSLDTATKDDGGDAGWVPRGILTEEAEDVLFALEPEGLTTFPVVSGTVVFQLLEKTEDRAIEMDHRLRLAQGALLEWMEGKLQEMIVVNNMDLTNGDVDKIDWAFDHAYLAS